jgi:DNA-binding transcriptional MerR regulator
VNGISEEAVRRILELHSQGVPVREIRRALDREFREQRPFFLRRVEAVIRAQEAEAEE